MKGKNTNRKKDGQKIGNTGHTADKKGTELEASSSTASKNTENTASSPKRQDTKSTPPPQPATSAEPTRISTWNRRATLTSTLGNTIPINTIVSPRNFSVKSLEQQATGTKQITGTPVNTVNREYQEFFCDSSKRLPRNCSSHKIPGNDQAKEKVQRHYQLRTAQRKLHTTKTT